MNEERPRTIDVGEDRSVTAVVTPAENGEPEWTFIYAPGAGSNIDDPFGRYVSSSLPTRGIACVRFQFPYQEAGKKSPDRAPVLEATWTRVIEETRPDEGRLAIGGRSMGGRIASQVLATGAAADALALFAYPLHPPGKPETRRDQHLPSITVPVLFCSGSNDAFASPEELHEVADPMPQAAVRILEHSDHGFNTRKSSGRKRQDVWAEAVDYMYEWLSGL